MSFFIVLTAHFRSVNEIINIIVLFNSVNDVLHLRMLLAQDGIGPD